MQLDAPRISGTSWILGLAYKQNDVADFRNPSLSPAESQLTVHSSPCYNSRVSESAYRTQVFSALHTSGSFVTPIAVLDEIVYNDGCRPSHHA